MNFSAKMLRDNALEDKVIVITGGGSGLGKAMTKYFMELGAKVAITSRDLEKLKTTATCNMTARLLIDLKVWSQPYPSTLKLPSRGS